MNDVSTPMIETLERFLNVTSQRHTLVVSNMANVDTPGYRARDLDFRGELRRAVMNDQVTFMPIVRSVPGLLERPDGNNVNIDREGLLLAETQMQFGLGVQMVRHEFQQLMSAINEGSKG